MNLVSVFKFKVLSLIVLTNYVFCDEATLPLKYEITIEPDLENFVFNGTTKLTFLVQAPTGINQILLDVKNLNLRTFQFNGNNGGGILFTPGNTIGFTSPEVLRPGAHTLEITYQGVINTETTYAGLYAVKPSENSALVALTNFGFTEARQVFPCILDPRFPSTFALRIIRPVDYFSISSTQKVGDTQIEGTNKIMDVFAESELLSTYQLSFALLSGSEYRVNNSNARFDVITSRIEEAGPLVDLSNKILAEMDKLYPEKIEHLTQLIVPDNTIPQESLVSSGLVIYRSSVGLIDDSLVTRDELQVFHENVALAFTKQMLRSSEDRALWGSANVWYQQGLAIVNQHNILKRLNPDLKTEEQFLVGECHGALRDENEVEEISLELVDGFDVKLKNPVFYTKAFLILRMLSNYRTPGGVATIQDDAIDFSWAKIKGYPVINIARSDLGIWNVTQTSSLPGRIWEVPLNFISNASTPTSSEFSHVLQGETGQLNLQIPENSWLISNIEQFGYYRVNYDRKNWDLITNQLQSGQFSAIDPINRAQIIDDSFNLASESHTPFDVYFQILKYVEMEYDLIPLNAFFETSLRLKTLLTGHESQGKFVQFAQKLGHHLLISLGFNIKPLENHADRLTRIKAINWLCNFDHEECQTEMHAQLASLQGRHPDMEEAVYCGGMRLGQIENFLFLREQYRLRRKRRTLQGLACSSDVELLRWYVLWIFGQSSEAVQIDNHDKIYALLAVIENSDIGTDTVLDVIIQNFNGTVSTLTSDDQSLLLISLSRTILTSVQRDKFDYVKNLLSTPGLIYQLDGTVDKNLQFRENHLESIDSLLNEELGIVPENTTTTLKPETTTSQPNVTSIPETTSRIPESDPTTTAVPETPPTEPTKPSGGGGAAVIQISFALIVTSVVTLLLRK